MERKHGGDECFAGKEQLRLLLLLGEHRGQQANPERRGTDARRVVEQKASAVELDRGHAECGGGQRGDGQQAVGGLHFGRRRRRAPVVDVEVVVGDHAFLVELDAVIGEREQVEHGDFALREGDALVEEGRFPRYA